MTRCNAHHEVGAQCIGGNHQPPERTTREVSNGDPAAHFATLPTGESVEWYERRGVLWIRGTPHQRPWRPGEFVAS